MTVTYEELAASPVETRKRSIAVESRFTATRLLKCAWSDRYSLVSEIANQSYPYLDSGNPFKPIQFDIKPYNDGSTVLAPGGSVGAVSYSHALVEVKYGLPPWDDDLENNISYRESLDSTKIYIPVEPYELKYDDGVWVSLNERPSRTVVCLKYEYRVISPYPPSGATISFLGCMNSGWFYTKHLGLSFPPYTVLYSDLQLDKSSSQAGTGSWDYRCTFEIHPVGWHVGFRGRDGNWKRYRSKKTNVLVTFFPPVNLNAVLL